MSNENRTALADSLQSQIDRFIDDLKDYNTKVSFPRDEKDYRFLKDFYTRLFKDRNSRAQEVSSQTYKEVRDTANAQFPSVTLWNLCMDGRVLAVLINGSSAGVGSSVRVPGGLLREFVYGDDGKLFLLEDSNFAFILRRALKKFQTKKIFEVFDSHIGCAARKAEEMAHGKMPQDAGLLVDVLYKQQMADATIEFVQKQFDGDISVVPIQTSFDPHGGFMYMGLETKNALDYARDHGNEYTDQVLQDLVKNHLILYAEELIGRLDLDEVFGKYAFSLDWKGQYLKSSKTFWTNVASMKDEVLPQIKRELLTIYPELDKDTLDAKDELDERAMLLLTNAYSGFLNNNMQDTHEDDHHTYPYGVHREEGIKVSEGGYPPYEISMFVVFSLDTENLPANIELAAGLVRANRREERVKDRSQTYADSHDFAQAPVPVVVQEIIREKISDEEWETLAKIDWHDMPYMWDTMPPQEFFEYLQKKGNMSIAVANGINNLRERMVVLYKPEQPTSGHLIQHYKVAMPVIVGANRHSHFILPFVKLGFKSA